MGRGGSLAAERPGRAQLSRVGTAGGVPAPAPQASPAASLPCLAPARPGAEGESAAANIPDPGSGERAQLLLADNGAPAPCSLCPLGDLPWGWRCWNFQKVQLLRWRREGKSALASWLVLMHSQDTCLPKPTQRGGS